MKTLFLILLSVSILMVACKSQEMAPVDEPPFNEEEHMPDPEPEPEPEPEEIRVLEERFTFDQAEDETAHDDNTYFVIVGSFIYRNNAENFTQTLRRQGFDPVILLSETGFNRVSVDSYDTEIPARTRIHYIRTNYPAYNDTWLLIRKP